MEHEIFTLAQRDDGVSITQVHFGISQSIGDDGIPVAIPSADRHDMACREQYLCKMRSNKSSSTSDKNPRGFGTQLFTSEISELIRHH
jgi:hypothetical protein